MVIGIDKEEDHVYFIISNTYTNLLLAPLLARHKQVDLQTGFSGNLFTRGVGGAEMVLARNVKKCAVGKYPKSEKPVRQSGCRLRLRPLPVLRRRQSQRVARIDPNAVVVDKNISTLSAARSAFIINCCSGPRAQAATHWPR